VCSPFTSLAHGIVFVQNFVLICFRLCSLFTSLVHGIVFVQNFVLGLAARGVFVVFNSTADNLAAPQGLVEHFFVAIPPFEIINQQLKFPRSSSCLVEKTTSSRSVPKRNIVVLFFAPFIGRAVGVRTIANAYKAFFPDLSFEVIH
jgi:hypothetical protein